MRAFPVRLPSGQRYWTVLDEDLQVIGVADAFLRHQRFGRDGAESTTKAYAHAIALFLRWCARTGRGWQAGVEQFGLFMVWLAHAGPAALRAGTSLVVLHAWHLPSPYADRVEARTHSAWWSDRGREMAEAALEPLRRAHPDLEVEVQVVHDDPAVALLHSSHDATLLVLAYAASSPGQDGPFDRVANHLTTAGWRTRAGEAEVRPSDVWALGPQGILRDIGTTSSFRRPDLVSPVAAYVARVALGASLGERVRLD